MIHSQTARLWNWCILRKSENKKKRNTNVSLVKKILNTVFISMHTSAKKPVNYQINLAFHKSNAYTQDISLSNTLCSSCSRFPNIVK